MREFFDQPPPDFTFYRGRGCEQCESTGYRGRRLVAELWIPSQNDVVLISKSAPFEELRASSARTTFSLADSAFQLLKDGHTNLEELIRMMPYSSIYRFREMVTQ
jgi:type IV pilus assembly protein PilB